MRPAADRHQTIGKQRHIEPQLPRALIYRFLGFGQQIDDDGRDLAPIERVGEQPRARGQAFSGIRMPEDHQTSRVGRNREVAREHRVGANGDGDGARPTGGRGRQRLSGHRPLALQRRCLAVQA